MDENTARLMIPIVYRQQFETLLSHCQGELTDSPGGDVEDSITAEEFRAILDAFQTYELRDNFYTTLTRLLTLTTPWMSSAAHDIAQNLLDGLRTVADSILVKIENHLYQIITDICK